MARPVAVLVPLLALLIGLGLPFLRVEFGAPDASILPTDVQSRRGFDLLRAHWGDGELAPVAARLSDDRRLEPAAARPRVQALADFMRRVAGRSERRARGQRRQPRPAHHARAIRADLRRPEPHRRRVRPDRGAGHRAPGHPRGPGHQPLRPDRRPLEESGARDSRHAAARRFPHAGRRRHRRRDRLRRPAVRPVPARGDHRRAGDLPDPAAHLRLGRHSAQGRR